MATSYAYFTTPITTTLTRTHTIFQDEPSTQPITVKKSGYFLRRGRGEGSSQWARVRIPKNHQQLVALFNDHTRGRITDAEFFAVVMHSFYRYVRAVISYYDTIDISASDSDSWIYFLHLTMYNYLFKYSEFTMQNTVRSNATFMAKQALGKSGRAFADRLVLNWFRFMRSELNSLVSNRTITADNYNSTGVGLIGKRFIVNVFWNEFTAYSRYDAYTPPHDSPFYETVADIARGMYSRIDPCDYTPLDPTITLENVLFDEFFVLE